MSVVDEIALRTSLGTALQRRYETRAARIHERDAVVSFMANALSEGWSWARIGKALDVSANAARRYYGRNRNQEDQ